MKYQDYYQTLGVARDASIDDIKRAYRKLARKYHPDVSKEANAEARFKEINEANAVLSDPEKRAAYDQLGANWRAGQDFDASTWKNSHTRGHAGFSAENAAEFSDFFSQLFGGGFAGGARRSGMPGQDQHAKLRIALEDAYHGATRTLQLALPSFAGNTATQGRTLQVRIPAGIATGQQIRLTGQGSEGFGGGPAGDLYLEVELEPHPLYRVEGRDVHLHLPVAPWEAALGATLTVPTLGGKVELKIPAGARAGQTLRLKGRGLPGKTPGDQYVVLQIVAPQADNPEKRALYERMAREMAFNPRSHLGV